jgi:type II secretory pathway component PulF
MTKFKYRAMDAEGNAVEDSLEATSVHSATRKLQERGLTVNTVEEAYADTGLLRVSNRLRWEDLQLLSEQLASIIRSGLPLVPSLKALAADLRHPRLKPVLEGLHDDLARGTALEDAIDRQHDRFPRMYPALVHAGEASGNLPGVLGLISEHATRMVDFKHRLQTAMIYPAVLCVSALAIAAYLMLKVVPVFGEIFSEMGAALPAPTKLLLRISEWLGESWPVLIAALAILVIGGLIAFAQLQRSSGGRYRLEKLWLYAPWIGPAYHLNVQARFCRTMSLLLTSRVPVLDALELSAASTGSPVLGRACEDAVLSVAAGERLSDALEDTGFFGYDATWLLTTSEDRGCAEEALESLANRFEREVQSNDRYIGAVIGPAFVILLGFIIAFIAVSLYLPLFTLGDQVGG